MNTSRSLRSALHFIIMSAAITSCGQTFNSNTEDDVLYGVSNYCQDQSNTNLCEANQIIQENCASCHTDMASFDTDIEWADSSYVTAGDSSASSVYSTTTNNYMPKDSTPLSDSEKEAIKTWIDAMSL